MIIRGFGIQNPKYNPISPNCTDPIENGLETLGYKLGINILPSQLYKSILNVPGLVSMLNQIQSMLNVQGSVTAGEPTFGWYNTNTGQSGSVIQP